MEIETLRHIVRQALAEDLSWGDITTESLIAPEWTSDLVLLLKQEGVVAGLPVAQEAFRQLVPDLEWQVLQPEGQWLPSGTPLVRLQGNAQGLLKAERVALNFLQRLSGIATLTRKFVESARQSAPQVRIADTRKTTPGLRPLERYAVRLGGGHNHRYNLSDAVLLKDNHLAILAKAGLTLKQALTQARQRIPHTMKIEVEVDTLEQLAEALTAPVDIILLDNMNYDQLRQAVEMNQGRVILEASGGVNLQTIGAIAATGVDVISIGALTHSAPALDISLDFAESLPTGSLPG